MPPRHPQQVPAEIRTKEAEALRKVWDREHGSLSQAQFAADNGWIQPQVYQYLKGLRSLNIIAARAFAKALRCEIAEFSERLATEDERRAWPFQRLKEDSWWDLSRSQRERLESLMLAEIMDWEDENSKSPPASPRRPIRPRP